MKQFTKHRHGERGTAHFVALFLFVALVGVVGFVGYNAWQKQATNAGGGGTVGNIQSRIKATEKNIKTTQASLVKARAIHKDKVKLATAAEVKFVAKRQQVRQASPDVNKKYLAKLDALAKRDAAAAFHKKVVAAAKKHGKVTAAEQKAINAAKKKLNAARVALQKAAKPFDTIRNTWSEYKVYAKAIETVNLAKSKVTKLEKNVKAQQKTLAKLKKNLKASKNNSKSAQQPTQKARAKCASGKVGTFTGVCLTRETAWKNNSCSTTKQGTEGTITTCKQSRTVNYETTSGSGVGYRTEHRTKRL